MEEHAKRCCVVFAPFRNANTDLQLQGSFLKRWRKEKEYGKLARRHIQFLVNVQNCRNSMNGGRPLDMVERLTSKPAKHGCLGEINFEEEEVEEVEDEISEALDQFLLEGSLEWGFDNEFRNNRGQFNCQSILTRCHGSHQCGSNLVICPNVGHGDRLLVVEARETMRRRFDDIRGKIGKVIDNKQLIGFLCGAGRTGKSHVIKTVIFDRPTEPFGGVPIVFSGDFTQLSPVGGVPLYKCDGFVAWKELINVFMELKVNHRFDKDLGWGELLKRFRDSGPTTDEVAIINSRVVGSHNGPLEKNIPPDAVYATKTNVDRMAINDAIFVKHLEKTHSHDASVQPPMHTLCIKAGNLRFRVRGTRKEYQAMENKAQDIIYAAVGEAHIQDKTKKYHDPLLKLYYGRPLCINQNEDVASCIANGAMCEFRGVKLKPDVSISEFETIVIDGYYVNCVSVTQIDSLLVKMLDGTAGGEGEYIIELKPKNYKCIG
ncbi:hypothetical protein IV203_027030 [Nitzschia inconspicua]|uniref:DNA helicase n=1 Tax=Nitzschia inconspicua TaxID=303405 RepID=A0A9K3LKW0_9STRA|nr:hypothetical protein IV203_027030 [Nitzschia inconspicua]